MAWRPGQRTVMFAATAALFSAYAASELTGPGLLRGIPAAFMILVLPGLGWSVALMPREEDTVLRIVVAVLASTVLNVAGLLAFMAAGLQPGRLTFSLYLFLMSCLGIAFSGRGRPVSLDRYQAAVLAVSLLVFSSNAAKMPLFPDMDVHFTVPSYGLVHELKPYKDISRVPYAFEHPTWGPFTSAMSIFLMGELGQTKASYTRARTIERTYDPEHIWRFWDRIPGTEESRAEAYISDKRGLLYGSRAPFGLIGALVLLVFFEIIRRQTSSVSLAAIGSALFIVPEVFVRFSTATYLTPIILVLLSLAYVYLYRPGSRTLFLLFGFFAAWINQRTVIFPVSLIAAGCLGGRKKSWSPAIMTCAGWAAGMAAYIVYGSLLNYNCFHFSFLSDHGIVAFFDGPGNTPGYLAAWSRAALYMNPVMFLSGLWAVGYFLVKERSERMRIIPIWFLTGFLVFLICRWPDTRYFYLVYPAMMICLFCYLGSMRKVTATAIIVLLAVTHVANSFSVYRAHRLPDPFYVYRSDELTPADAIRSYAGTISHGGKGKKEAQAPRGRQGPGNKGGAG